MTKEELKQEAEEYFKSICGDYNEEYERTGKRHYWVGYDIKDAYLASAEPREKRIAELEKENELLKADLEFTAKTSNENKQTVKAYSKLVDEYSSEGADLQDRIKELEQEITELKKQVSFLKDNLRVARKDRENLKLNIGKGLQEFIKDCPYTALKLYADKKYVEENAELKEQIKELKKRLEMGNKVYNDNLDYSYHIEESLTKAKEIILKLYNAGRDVLMCRAEEKAYDNLDEAINDRSIEQFLREVEK